jgi:hypothetical protein
MPVARKAKPFILLGCVVIVPAMLLFSYWNGHYPFRDEDTGDDIFSSTARFLLAAAVIAAFFGLMLGGGECRSRYC